MSIQRWFEDGLSEAGGAVARRTNGIDFTAETAIGPRNMSLDYFGPDKLSAQLPLAPEPQGSAKRLQAFDSKLDDLRAERHGEWIHRQDGYFHYGADLERRPEESDESFGRAALDKAARLVENYPRILDRFYRAADDSGLLDS